MKINPIHSMGTNPYKKVAKEDMGKQEKKKERDQLEISTEAKQLLNGTEWTERDKKVHELKKLIESGKYEINYKKTAEKLLDYWKNK
ncbi:flagellar biosynthesis anti-sigma factor FlgM [Pueribacillus sp. YX66]|uniref:flagellar biosynthesis anti-sigma factor FlgM n=1 Tax=Pueribacillus sp. YX66 TaxID=3229242 RepID=UPI00358CE063